MDSSSGFLEAYTLGKNHGKPHWLKPDDGAVAKSDPYCILTDKDGNEKVHSLAHLLPMPNRQKGSYIMGDLESFIKFMLSNRAEDQSVIWWNESFFPEDCCDTGKAFVCCVMNENTGTVPGWRDFYCWMITDSATHTEAVMTDIIKRVKNIPIYRGMPDVVLPEAIEKKLIKGGIRNETRE